MGQRGGSVAGDYRAPLFLAWQLTNACGGRCLHCCEASGAAWPDELPADEALRIAAEVAALGVVEVAFGGGEPLGVPYVWRVFDILKDAGVALKIETDGLAIDERAADRLAALAPECIQISLDGADAAAHGLVRPGGDFYGACAAVARLVQRGIRPEIVFVPTRLNRHQAVAALARARRLGARRFVSGPLMRLGRAEAAWGGLALSPSEWESCADALRAAAPSAGDADIELVIYPHDIVQEVRARARAPQAMLLVVPNGHVKLLNALPFSCADLRRTSLAEAWQEYLAAWRRPEVIDFCRQLAGELALLRHANEIWPLARDPSRNARQSGPAPL